MRERRPEWPGTELRAESSTSSKSIFRRVASWFTGKSTAPQVKDINISHILDLVLGQESIGTTYESRARRGYMENHVVYRAIRMMANASISAPLELFQERGGELEQVEDPNHPVLRLIERPNPKQSYERFIERLVSFLLIGGSCPLIRATTTVGVEMIWAIRPDKIEAVKGSSGEEVVRWKVGSTFYELEDVLLLQLFNPLDEGEGMSPIQAAAVAIDQGNMSRKWNQSLLKNRGRPSILLNTTEPLDPVNKERLREEYRERHAALDAIGDVMILGGVKIEELGLKPIDMDWLPGQQAADRSTAVGLGAPPQALGDTAASTFSNYEEARKALYQEEAMPLLHWIIGEINHWLFRGPSAISAWRGLSLVPNVDEVDALQEDRNQQWERVGGAEVLTIDEKRRALGYEELGDIRGERLILKNGTIMEPDGTIVRSSRQESDEQRAGADEKLLRDVVSGVVDTALEAMVEKHLKTIGHSSAVVGAFSLTKENRRLYAKRFDRRREEHIKSASALAAELFEREGRRVAARVRKAGSITRVGSAVDKELSSADTKSEWTLFLESTYEKTATAFARQIINDGIKSFAPLREKVFSEFEGDVADAIRAYLEAEAGKKIKGITDTTLDSLRRTLTEGIESGESIDQLAKRVESVYADWTEARAKRIARTETIAASNYGSLEGAKLAAEDAEIEFQKEWISTHDDRTRGNEPKDSSSHVALDGALVDQDKQFRDPRSGSKMDFPGDVSHGARPGDVLNCRCTLGYVPKD